MCRLIWLVRASMFWQNKKLNLLLLAFACQAWIEIEVDVTRLGCPRKKRSNINFLDLTSKKKNCLHHNTRVMSMWVMTSTNTL